MVRPRILIYPRRRALRRVVLEGDSESARDVGGEGSVLEVCDRRGGGVDG